jgi:FixJ family two-component response regulator
MVYIVEDDASLCRALQRLARSAGFRAQAFATGEAFLGALSEERPACVVLDLNLPGIHGLEVQRRLAQTDPALPVVVITGYADEDARRKAITAGAAAFLLMPLDDRELLGAIQLALSQSDDDAGRHPRRACGGGT